MEALLVSTLVVALGESATRRSCSHRCWPRVTGALGLVVTTADLFLAEMGDKTQFATVMLAAKFISLSAVVVGTTAGMMLTNVPVLFASNLLSARIPFKTIRIAAAALSRRSASGCS